MSVGSFFKKLVPYLSTAAEAFGGPVGAIAASVLTKVTGATVKAGDLATAITSLSMSEQGRLQLDSAEKEFAETMAKMGYDSADKLSDTLEQDRASARSREVAVRDSTPKVLAYLTLLIAAGIVAIVFTGRAPALHDPVESATVGTIIGFVFRDLARIFAYYFGGDVADQTPSK